MQNKFPIFASALKQKDTQIEFLNYALNYFIFQKPTVGHINTCWGTAVKTAQQTF